MHWVGRDSPVRYKVGSILCKDRPGPSSGEADPVVAGAEGKQGGDAELHSECFGKMSYDELKEFVE